MSQHEAYDPADDGWERVSTGPFDDLIGPLWRRDEAGAVASGLLTVARHGNHRGIVHGGVIMAILDHGLAIAGYAASGGSPQVTVQLDVQFIAAVELGAFLVVRAEVTRATKSLLFLRGSGFVGEQVVAVASGIWKRVVLRPIG